MRWCWSQLHRLRKRRRKEIRRSKSSKKINSKLQIFWWKIHDLWKFKACRTITTEDEIFLSRGIQSNGWRLEKTNLRLKNYEFWCDSSQWSLESRKRKWQMESKTLWVKEGYRRTIVWHTHFRYTSSSIKADFVEIRTWKHKRPNKRIGSN